MAGFLPLVIEASIDFLLNVPAKCTTLETGYVPLGADVTPFDNSQTSKQGRGVMAMPMAADLLLTEGG